MTSDYKRISQITANNVALRDQYIVVGDETIRLPQPPELLAYLTKVRETYQRWADLPDDADEPLFDPDVPPDEGQDDYRPLDAKPLPMRVAEFRDQPSSQEPDATGAAGRGGRRQAYGHPGRTGQRQDDGAGAAGLGDGQRQPRAAGQWRRGATGRAHLCASWPTIQGESDLLPMLRRVLSRNGISLASNMTVRATLQATDAHFVLLLDGLNELSRTHGSRGWARSIATWTSSSSTRST